MAMKKSRFTQEQIAFALRQAESRTVIEEIAAAREKYGYLQIHVLLRREDWKNNRRRVYRLYAPQNRRCDARHCIVTSAAGVELMGMGPFRSEITPQRNALTIEIASLY